MSEVSYGRCVGVCVCRYRRNENTGGRFSDTGDLLECNSYFVEPLS